MDQAKTLIRTVVRTFYDTEHVVIIDSIVNHSALTLDDFKQIFAFGARQPKEIAKYLGKLREGGLVSCYGRQETKAGAQKASTVEYWWIDYQLAIDAIKFRLHMLQTHLEQQGKSTSEKKEYSCRVCKSEWTALEVLDNPDPEFRGSGFLCKRCNNVLDWKPHNTQDGRDNNVLSQFNTQLGHILGLVESIDKIIVPNSTPESAIENIKPVPRHKEAGAVDTEKLDNLTTMAQPTSVKGIKAQAEKVEIVLTTESENTAAAQQAEADRRAKIAAQNQLPEWHTKSTISGEVTRIGHNQTLLQQESLASVVEDGTEKKAVLNNDAMDKFFATLERERAQAGEVEKVDEEEEEESDEDEFEDVTSPVLKRPKLEDQAPLNSESSQSQVDGETPDPNRSNNNISVPPVTSTLEDDDSEEEEFEEVV
jgi:transcription initiation factor TFIIE subunit alpha